MLAVNGQFPGPLIEANWGDNLEITVINELQNNGTSMHWHGFRQELTNTEDGVGGVTECPIAPGSQKIYKFRATSYGTTWYHSHFSAQYGDGVVGPVIIHGPASANYDIDLGHITVSELYPLTTFQEDWFAHRYGPPLATNYLLNGQNIRIDLSAGTRPTWTFQPGKKHLLRFINTSVDMLFKLQLDNHKFTVIANDFVPLFHTPPQSFPSQSVNATMSSSKPTPSRPPITSVPWRRKAAATSSMTAPAPLMALSPTPALPLPLRPQTTPHTPTSASTSPPLRSFPLCPSPSILLALPIKLVPYL